MMRIETFVLKALSKSIRPFSKPTADRLRRHAKRHALRNAANQTPSLTNIPQLTDEQIQWLRDTAAAAINLPTSCAQGTIDLTRCAVHIHAFYPDLIGPILKTIHEAGGGQLSIYVTTVDETGFLATEQISRELGIPLQQIHIVENRGRDLGPLFTALKHLFEKYDYICHLHTKRSPHTAFGDAWREYLIDALVGTAEQIQNQIAYLDNNPNCGLLYPANFPQIRPYTVSTAIAPYANKLLSRLDRSWKYRLLDFPAGSMCWIRSNCFAPYLTKMPALDEYEPEASQVDLTLAHAWERCLSLVPTLQGFTANSFKTRMIRTPARKTQPTQTRVGWNRDTPSVALSPKKDLAPTNYYYNPKSLNIHWVIPTFGGPGAGGHRTIFRMMSFLEEFGHRQTIWLQNSDPSISEGMYLERIREWYEDLTHVHVKRLPENVDWIDGDVVVATDCWTAYPVRSMSRFKERFYLIQDFEPSFHAAGDLYLTAESTYKFGFAGLCAGNWLLDIAHSYGMWARSWNLCVDHDTYNCKYRWDRHTQSDQPLHIAFYARIKTERRAVRLGLYALNELYRHGANIRVTLFGQENLDTAEVIFPFVNRGILSEAELSRLYNDADIGVVFSATNYSLIPLEMMACGLPVVELNTPSTRAAFSDDVVCFADPSISGIVDSVDLLLKDPEYRTELSERGRKYATDFMWKDSARAIEAAILERLRGKDFTPVPPPRTQMSAPAKRSATATVVIPTHNAGAKFEEVLNILQAQDTPWKYDILVIDSDSSDGTRELVRSKKIRLHEIKKEEFQHGRTRNLGASLSDSDFIAFITQDATPLDQFWLRNLIAGFDYGDRVAGVFGRHKAYPDHDAFTHRDINFMFDRFARLGKLYDWDTDFKESSRGSVHWKLLLAFYSDNNSAMRRSVWENIPYPEIEWGEDQVWSWNVIQAGFQKAYADNAVVLHSHDTEKIASSKSARHECDLFGKYFGFEFSENGQQALLAMKDRIRSERRFGHSRDLSEEVIEARVRQVVSETIGRAYRQFGLT